jgi:ABC-type branched-subunit amino acid transport system substrate-binding protein
MNWEIGVGNRSRRSSIFVVLAALGVLAAVMLSACGGGGSSSDSSASGSETSSSGGGEGVVKLGALMSQSGEYAQYEEFGYNGVKLAAEQINEEGGFEVGGEKYTLEVELFDPKSEVANAVAGARKFAEDDSIPAVFGPLTSDTLQAVAPILGKSKLEFSSGGKSNEVVEESSTYPLFTSTSSPFGGKEGVYPEIGAEMFEKYGIKTIAALNPEDPAGQAYTPPFLEGFEEAGGKVVYNEYFPPETSDFSPYMHKIAAAHADALFFGYTEAAMVPIMTEARQLNAVKYYIGGGGSTEVPAEESGNSPETNYVWPTAVLSTTLDPTPQISEYVKTYKQSTGSPESPNISISLLTYPYVFALVQAMERAETVSDTAKIAEALHGETWKLANGPIPTLPIAEDGQGFAPYQLCNLFKGIASPECETVSPSLEG